MDTTQQPPDDKSSSAENNDDQTALFHRLNSYPFHTDPEFAKGLSIILGHPETPATDAEVNRSDDLVLQAKCFYFSRCVFFGLCFYRMGRCRRR